MTSPQPRPPDKANYCEEAWNKINSASQRHGTSSGPRSTHRSPMPSRKSSGASSSAPHPPATSPPGVSILPSPRVAVSQSLLARHQAVTASGVGAAALPLRRLPALARPLHPCTCFTAFCPRRPSSCPHSARRKSRRSLRAFRARLLLPTRLRPDARSHRPRLCERQHHQRTVVAEDGQMRVLS